MEYKKICNGYLFKPVFFKGVAYKVRITMGEDTDGSSCLYCSIYKLKEIHKHERTLFKSSRKCEHIHLLIPTIVLSEKQGILGKAKEIMTEAFHVYADATAKELEKENRRRKLISELQEWDGNIE